LTAHLGNGTANGTVTGVPLRSGDGDSALPPVNWPADTLSIALSAVTVAVTV
jgi:hypothetical protein